MNRGHVLARAIVDEFVRAGMRHACISPGSRSTPVAAALAADARIDARVVIDERSAAFLALGMAAATRTPVAVVCTSGTAATNLHPAVAEADQGRVPLIALTADRPPELRATGANQTIDQIKLYGDAVRFFCEVGAPAGADDEVRYYRSLASRAWAAAIGSPPGPVHLNVALREPLAAAPDEVPAHDHGARPGGEPWTRVSPPAGAAAPADVDRLARLVAGAERGLVVAGAGEVDPEPVLRFARAARWPVIAEPASGARTSGDVVASYDALLRVERFRARHRPDLVVRTGRVGLSRALTTLLGPDVPQVLVDRDGAWLDPERTASWIVAAAPESLLGAVAETVERDDTEWVRAWRDADARARAAIDEVLDGEVAPSEPRAARDLAACLPGGTTLVVAASMPVRDLDWFMAPRPGLRVLANRGANGIDGTVSTALGAALAVRGPCAALLGDLALIHDQNGLTVSGADAALVVINNDGGGIFSFLPQARHPEHFERLFGTPHGLDVATLARLHGCGHDRVELAADLPDAVRAALRGGVNLVEVRTDRAANVALHDRIWAAVDRAVG